MTLADGHAEVWAYQSRYYDIHVIAPADFHGVFDRDGFLVHGRPTFEGVLEVLEEQGPWDAVVCYGPFGEAEWPLVTMRTQPTTVFALDYAGGPLCDLNGQAHPGAQFFDHVFTAHETQAAWLRGLGVPATKARGVPTNRYKPIPGTPKQWHAIYPAQFSPTKRAPLVAEYLERYAIQKPSLFIGGFENPAIVDMVRMGGIPLNKPGFPHRNKIEIGPRAPYAVMPLLYNASEVCIVGSQEEAGPWVALEAMACGVPTIVMSDCAWGVAEAFAALQAEYGGCEVVPPDPVAIHEAVERLLADPEAPRKARRAIVERYSWFAMYDSIDRVLKNLSGFKHNGQAAA